MNAKTPLSSASLEEERTLSDPENELLRVYGLEDSWRALRMAVCLTGGDLRRPPWLYSIGGEPLGVVRWVGARE